MVAQRLRLSLTCSSLEPLAMTALASQDQLAAASTFRAVSHTAKKLDVNGVSRRQSSSTMIASHV